MNTKNYMIDTSVILEELEYIINAIKDGNNVFITDIILQELDGKKGEEGRIGFNARKFFRMMGSDNGTAYYTIPGTDKSLQKGDSLRKMSFSIEDKNMPVYVFVRSNYKTRNINDSKIIEVAKDYGLTLLTRDMAQKVRALSEGVGVEMANTNKDANSGEIVLNYRLIKDKEGIRRVVPNWEKMSKQKSLGALASNGKTINNNQSFKYDESSGILAGIVFLVIFCFLSIVLSIKLFENPMPGIFLSIFSTIIYLRIKGILEPGESKNEESEFGEGWLYTPGSRQFEPGIKWLGDD